MTTEKKYQIFVSATYTDLQDARQQLVGALLSMGMIPTGMELHLSDSSAQWQLMQRIINDCDYYVMLLGGRYGTLSPMGLSHTHREYTYAVAKGKPVIAFLHDHPERLPQESRERSQEGEVRFNDFRRLLLESSVFRYWSSAPDLGLVVKKALPAFMKQYPACGWVRAGQVSDLNVVREVQELRKQIELLEAEKEQLTSSWRPPTESLARSSDAVSLQYGCNVYIKGDCKATMLEARPSWDQVFATMAPQMMNEVPESVMRHALEEHIAKDALRDAQALMAKAHAVRNVLLSTQSFNQVKIQLRALGWIRKVTSKDLSGAAWWQLTPLGDQVMTKALSIKRK